MSEVAERLKAVKKEIGRARYSMHEHDSLEDVADRMDNLENAVGKLVDIMIEAAEEGS